MHNDSHIVPPDAGFTLVEVLVALAIFSLAALALLRLQGAAITATARLDDHGLAAITAENLGLDALLAAAPPAFGNSEGDTSNAGRRWHWRQTVTRTPDVRLQRIDIGVAGIEGGGTASITLIRRLP